MDVEKTIQFLIGTAAQHDECLAKIEADLLKVDASLLTLGNGLIALTGVVQTLSENMQAMQREGDRVWDRIDALREEMRGRDRVLDARIDRLVSTIGAMARTNPPADHP